MLVFNIVLIVLTVIAEGILIGGFIAGKGRNKLPLIVGPLIFILSFLFIFNEVKQVTYEVQVELGDELSLVPEDYLSGVSFVVSNSSFDMENVDLGNTGDYVLTIRHFIQTFEVQIAIRDTTPPELKLVDGPVYVEKDKTIDVTELVASTYDISGRVDVKFKENYRFDACGEKTVSVVATDKNNNSSVESFTLVVDTAPTFDNGQDFYLAVGKQADFAKHITAYDDVDGNLTDRIVMDASEVNCDEKGEYTVYYTVTDQYGLHTETETSVYVLEPMEIQELINTHKINRNEEEIVGAPNLYDGGIYEGKTIDEIADCIRPAIVCLFYKTKNGWSRGSGFIISIDEEDIIICTNYHVISGGDNPEVHFFDNKTAPGEVVAKGMVVCSEDDIAFVRVKRKDVKAKTMEKLQTIHINKKYYDSLEKTERVELRLQSMDQNGNIWFDETGILLDKSTTYPDDKNASKYGHLTWVSIRMKPGVSGSAIVDSEGNLITMAVSHYGTGRAQTNYGIRLEQILQMYAANFHRQAYYE